MLILLILAIIGLTIFIAAARLFIEALPYAIGLIVLLFALSFVYRNWESISWIAGIVIVIVMIVVAVMSENGSRNKPTPTDEDPNKTYIREEEKIAEAQVITGENSGLKMTLKSGTAHTMGSSHENSLVFRNSNFISRNHCKLSYGSNNEVILEDYSTNGTYVNGEKVNKTRKVLRVGDRVNLANTDNVILIKKV